VTALVIFAFSAALLYGGADFLGGVAARRATPLAVIALTMPAGAVILLAILAAGRGVPGLGGLTAVGGGWASAGWAIGGGAVGAAGLIAFYRGFATASMSVVAPVSALVSTVLPVAIALAGGERPGITVIAGAPLCLAAIVLVSAERTDSAAPRARLRGVAYGVTAGAAFGLFFVFLKYAGQNGGHDTALWLVTVQRLTGSVLALVMLAITRTQPPWRGGADRGLLRIALISGAADAAANVCYVMATQTGQFGLAVVITSLYPGMTVLLARLVLRERMRLVQRIGLLLAAAGVVLVTM